MNLLIIAAVSLVILVFITIILLNSWSKFPSGLDAMIMEVQNEVPPVLVKGETGTTDGHEVSIYYEVIRPSVEEKGTVLLINGHTRTMLDWPPYIIEPLTQAGFKVIRFDNRGIGMSDWMSDWSKENCYNLEDMAKDAEAVMDATKTDRAHIIGVSMGGMISQRLAISYPERVLSLTSIMSTGFFNDKKLTNVPKPFAWDLIRLNFKYKRGLSKEAIKLKYHLGIQLSLMGNGGYEVDYKASLRKALFEARERKGYNARAFRQHSMAIVKSGSRYEELAMIKAPTLVIHGEDDPLILIEHGRKYAPMIPNSKTLFVKGMGHDLPQVYIDKILNEILIMIDVYK